MILLVSFFGVILILALRVFVENQLSLGDNFFRQKIWLDAFANSWLVQLDIVCFQGSKLQEK